MPQVSKKIEKKTDLEFKPKGWPGEDQWQAVFRQEKNRLQQCQQGVPVPEDPEEAERLVQDRQRILSYLATKAEAAFWNSTDHCFIGRNQPFIHTKTFSAERCARVPSEKSARHWFRVLAEQYEVEQVVERFEAENALPEKLSSWLDVLKKVRNIETKYQVADFVWQEHCQWSTAENPWIVLRSWVLATLGSAYLLRMLQRDQPGANKALLQDHVTIETVAFVDRSPLIVVEARQDGKLFKLLTVELPMGFLRADLSVPDFAALPSRVATLLQQSFKQDEEALSRLLPKTRDELLKQSSPISNPVEAALASERTAIIAAEVQTLPLQRRRVMELRQEGFTRQETAVELGIGNESVKTHLSCAYKQLRSALPAKLDFPE